MRLPKLTAPATIALLFATPAAAQDGMFERSTLSGVVVAGPVVAGGELAWTEGGFGKLEYDDLSFDLDAIVAWRPRFSQRLAAHISLAGQRSLDEGTGLDEAFIRLRRDPRARVGFSGRAGLFFPPASREHDGPDWSTRYTLTPSALGTWIAEEIKVVGLEGTIHVPLGEQSGSMTVAVFGANDTAGTLLAFRGWALHDIRATALQTLALPPVSDIYGGLQAPRTRPVAEVDGRPGFYARGEASLSRSLKLGVLAYHNNGDRTSLSNGQYSWATRFLTLDAQWQPNDDTVVIVQALAGDTEMGVTPNTVIMADVDFNAAYLLVSRYLETGSLTARIDAFNVHDNSFVIEDNNEEWGVAVTGSWARPLAKGTELVAESVAVLSDRPSRERLGEQPRQFTVSARLALRTRF